MKYHRQALVLCPQTASTLSAMGYTYALTGCYSNAVDCFHKVSQRPLLNLYSSSACAVLLIDLTKYTAIWNSLPHNVRFCESLTTFRKHLKTLFPIGIFCRPLATYYPAPQIQLFDLGALLTYLLTYAR